VKQIKFMIIGIFIGAALGFWVGVNTGKERPIFSNPFTEVKIKETIKTTGDKFIEKSGEVMEKSGQKLEESGQAMQKKSKEVAPDSRPSE